MLVQRCALDQHRLILPVSITKPVFANGAFQVGPWSTQIRALVDTGAQCSLLSRSLVLDQKLVRVGHKQIAGVHGEQTHSRYLACLGFWVRRVNPDDTAYAYNQAERSLFNLDEPIEVVDMQQNLNFDMLLGFDILKHLAFSFDNRSQIFELVVQPR